MAWTNVLLYREPKVEPVDLAYAECQNCYREYQVAELKEYAGLLACVECRNTDLRLK